MDGFFNSLYGPPADHRRFEHCSNLPRGFEGIVHCFEGIVLIGEFSSVFS